MSLKKNDIKKNKKQTNKKTTLNGRLELLDSIYMKDLGFDFYLTFNFNCLIMKYFLRSFSPFR